MFRESVLHICLFLYMGLMFAYFAVIMGLKALLELAFKVVGKGNQ